MLIRLYNKRSHRFLVPATKTEGKNKTLFGISDGNCDRKLRANSILGCKIDFALKFFHGFFGNEQAKARRNLAHYEKETGLCNTEFRLGEIEHLPVADNSVDAIISNCVINLSPDKPQVWREMARVLKPGGRVAVSDMALLQPLPAEVLKLVEALVGCVVGAVLVDDTERYAQAAGLENIRVRVKPEYVVAMDHFEDPLYEKIVALLPPGTKPEDYIASVEVTARKPDCAYCCASKS